MAPPKSCKVCEGAQSRYKCPACLIPYCSLACFKKHKEIPCINPAPVPEAPMTTSLPADNERPSSVDEPSKTLQPVHLESTEIPCVKPAPLPDAPTTTSLPADIERPSADIERSSSMDEPSKTLQPVHLEPTETSLPADIERPSSVDDPSKTPQPVHLESTDYFQVGIERPCYVDNPSNVLQQLQLESIASSSEIREALKNEELQKLIRNIDGSADSLAEFDKTMDLEAFQVFTDKILSTITK